MMTGAKSAVSKHPCAFGRGTLGFLPSLPLLPRFSSRACDRSRICAMSSESPSKVNFGNAASQSASYEEVIVKPLTGPFVDVLQRLAPPAMGDSCLDVATGTGPVAFRVAELVGESGKVLGVDYSEEMLEIAKQNALSSEKKSFSDRISWKQADACTMSLPNASFDRAYCREGLQFMPDPRRACELIRKALKPGGTFVASCKAPADAISNPMFAAFRSAMNSIGKSDWADMLHMPTSWAESETAGVERFKSCLQNSGFEGVTVVIEDTHCSLASIDRVYAVVTALPHGDELVGNAALFDAFKSHVRQSLEPYIDTETGVVSVSMRGFFARGVSPPAGS